MPTAKESASKKTEMKVYDQLLFYRNNDGSSRSIKRNFSNSGGATGYVLSFLLARLLTLLWSLV